MCGPKHNFYCSSDVPHKRQTECHVQRAFSFSSKFQMVYSSRLYFKFIHVSSFVRSIFSLLLSWISERAYETHSQRSVCPFSISFLVPFRFVKLSFSSDEHTTTTTSSFDIIFVQHLNPYHVWIKAARTRLWKQFFFCSSIFLLRYVFKEPDICDTYKRRREIQTHKLVLLQIYKSISPETEKKTIERI